MKINFKNRIVLFFLIIICYNQSLHSQNEEIELWNSEIPGGIVANDYQELNSTKLDQVSNVKIPTLTVFVPEQPNGTSMVICPGGGYAYLAINKEGYKVAEWLNSLGITAFVLKYRLPSDIIMEDKTIGPLQDAQEAVRFIRRNAKKWHLNIEKIGVIGFSAGGHLASTLATHYNDMVYNVSDSVSAKPNFSILIYPVISMEETFSHKGSRNKLLGTSPSNELIERYSNEKQIDSLTPPTFLVHAIDDNAVPAENSINYFLALKQYNIPSEIHLYQNGKHGFGLGILGTSKNWTKQCEDWLLLNNYTH